MLDKKLHDPIYAIYGFVRLADEIVDTFHDFDKDSLLNKFIDETYQSIAAGISTNPVLQAFQDVVNKYKIQHELIRAFFHSMKMDLLERTYTENDYAEYIYGSAEAVGLMCLKVFCDGEEKKYNSLVEPARKLGSAFQKVNFLRDMKSDFSERGRVYFPHIDFISFDNTKKKEIEADIKKDFEESLDGIRKLPKGSQLGVMTAYIYYLTLLKKIALLPVNKIQTERIRVPNAGKIYLLIMTWFRYHLRLI